MGIENLERFHSKILAWLLDRRIEHGTHAQGNLGFRLFLKELGKDLAVESNPQIITYPDEQYWVRCEASGDESRIDIEIAASGKFVIHIENKIQAPEGPKQIPRESRDLNERRKDLGVPKENSHAIFLTLDGTAPEDKRFRRFRPVRWGRIAHVFENFEKEAQPNEVKLFARHYAKAVRKLSAAEPIEKEPQYGEANV
jgi:hypothetical protein